MKKKIILLLILLIPFIVGAKEDYSFAWEYSVDNPSAFGLENKDGYAIGTFVENMPVHQINKQTGKLIKTYSTLDSYKEAYPSNAEMIYYAKAKTDGLFINKVDDKIVNYNVSTGELQICGISEPNSNVVACTTKNVLEMEDTELKKYTGKYYFIIKLHKSESTNYHYGFYSDGLYEITTFDPSNNKYYFSVYNDNEKLIKKIEYNSLYEYYTAAIQNNAIYIIKTTRSFEKNNNAISYKLTKYSLSGEQLNTTDITSIIMQSQKITSANLIKYTAQFADGVDGGLVLKLYNDPQASYIVTCTGSSSTVDDTVVSNCYSAYTNSTSSESTAINQNVFAKINIEYEVNISVSGHGSIRVVNNASSGEGVTFEVIPEKGYVLGEILVTDETGNTIKVTNNTFTMPSANVTIKATFIENPNTGAFVSGIVVITALLIACIVLVVTEKNNKIKTIS